MLYFIKVRILAHWIPKCKNEKAARTHAENVLSESSQDNFACGRRYFYVDIPKDIYRRAASVKI